MYVCVYVCFLCYDDICVCACVRVQIKTKEQLTFTNYINHFHFFQTGMKNKDLCQDHLISSLFFQLYHNILHCLNHIGYMINLYINVQLLKYNSLNDYCESNKTNFTTHILAPIDKNDNRLQSQQK